MITNPEAIPEVTIRTKNKKYCYGYDLKKLEIIGHHIYGDGSIELEIVGRMNEMPWVHRREVDVEIQTERETVVFTGEPRVDMRTEESGGPPWVEASVYSATYSIGP